MLLFKSLTYAHSTRLLLELLQKIVRKQIVVYRKSIKIQSSILIQYNYIRKASKVAKVVLMMDIDVRDVTNLTIWQM